MALGPGQAPVCCTAVFLRGDIAINRIALSWPATLGEADARGHCLQDSPPRRFYGSTRNYASFSSA